jgi:hypothetical protein
MDFMQLMGNMPHAQWMVYMGRVQPIAPQTPKAVDRMRNYTAD